MAEEQSRAESVREVLLQHLRTLPDATLQEIANKTNVPGGFRRNSSTGARLLVETSIRRTFPKLAENLRSRILPFTPAARLLDALSTRALHETLGGWIARIGEAETIAALLLCNGNEQRELGEKMLSGPSAGDADAQRTNFAALFELFQGGQTLQEGQSLDQRQKDRSETTVLREELRQARKEAQGNARALDDLRACRARLEQAQAETNLKADELASLRAEHTRVTQSYESLKAHLESRLAAGVEARLAKEFHGWLRPARQAEAVALALDGSLEEFARGVIAKQEATDRTAGNRARIEEELRSLQGLQERVSALLRHSIVRVPELPEVAERLERRIGELRSVLKVPDAAADGLEGRLEAAVLGASGRSFAEMRTMFEGLHKVGILSEDSLQRLEGLWHQRLGAIQATGELVDKDAPEPSSRLSPTVLRLQSALRGQEPAILLLDGHNIVFTLKNRYAPERGTARSQADRREALVTDVKALVANLPTLRGWVFFDGKERSDASPAENLRVSYSGGEGEHRADNALLDQIRAFREEAYCPTVFLVTDDGDLRGKAQRLGAVPVFTHQFAGFLP